MSALTSCLALALMCLPGDPPEWGGFRGNNGAGIADSTEIPDALDPAKNVRWRTEVPKGYSSPTVTGDAIFLTASKGKTLSTLCIDRRTGEVRWRAEVEFDGRRPGANSPAAPSPVTDGERVYALFHHVGLIAYDLAGKELWRKELGTINIPHGLATSPVVHGDSIVLQIDQDADSYLVALDKKTGAERWKTERPGVTHSYASPAIYAPEKGPAQVVVSGSFQACGYSLATGEKLWWVDGAAWQTKNVPVIAGDHCIISAYMVAPSEFGLPTMTQSWEEVLAEHDADGDGEIVKSEWEHEMLHQAWFIFDLGGDGKLGVDDYAHLQKCGKATGGLFAIRLDGRGDVTGSHVTWRNEDRKGLPDIPSPLLASDTLYMIKEGGILSALDPATGKVGKRGRVGEPDSYYASPIAAAGKVVTASKSGQLAVITGGREWEVVSVAKLDEEVWATPAIAGGQVFVRSNEALYCFEDAQD